MALLDRDPWMGNTCLNYGCIPSKIMMHVMDRVAEMQGARGLGVAAELEGIDFSTIMGSLSSRLRAWKRFPLPPTIEHLYSAVYPGQKAEEAAKEVEAC